jgi:hypothetical protein
MGPDNGCSCPRTYHPHPTNIVVLLCNAACLAEKEQVQIITCMVRSDRGSNSLFITPEESMVTMQFILTADSRMYCRYTLFLVRN